MSNQLQRTASAIRGLFRQRAIPPKYIDLAFEEIWDEVTSGTSPYPNADWVRFIRKNSDSKWHYKRIERLVERGYHPQEHI